ncbi:MAG: hypothetical protein HY996_11890 [Micrococcales bacterium]|nr:hypothetical protein [Micrococcales bacterium]
MVNEDHELAAAVEQLGRPIASCFPPSLANAPDVDIDFQISVSGLVTRTEVTGQGADRTVTECVRRVAETVRFPTQDSPRAFRYPLRLRRADAGTPAPR